MKLIAYSNIATFASLLFCSVGNAVPSPQATQAASTGGNGDCAGLPICPKKLTNCGKPKPYSVPDCIKGFGLNCQVVIDQGKTLEDYCPCGVSMAGSPPGMPAPTPAPGFQGSTDIELIPPFPSCGQGAGAGGTGAGGQAPPAGTGMPMAGM